MGRTAAALVLATLFLAGCSGGDGKPASPPSGSAAPGAPPRAADERIIRKWADDLRVGEVESATRLFAVPATVANGAGPQVLDTRELIFRFNASLPCGAKLLATQPKGPYTVATFRLTERRGGACGPGADGKAATAFRIEDGKIVEWLRVAVPETPPPAPEPEPNPEQPPPSERPGPADTV